MIKKILTIAKWEYLEKVKTKTFIISLIITPLIIILFAILPSLLFRDEAPKVEIIGIIDSSGIYYNQLKEEFEKYKLDDGQNNYVLINLFLTNREVKELKLLADNNILKNMIEGYLLINNGGTDSLHAEYVSKSIGNYKIVSRFEEVLNSIRIKQKLAEAGIKPDLASTLQERINVQQLKVEEAGKVSELDFLTTFFLSIVLILLLMMIVVYSGQMLVRSMIEEKSSRLIEILVSSCTPEEILTGKILGLASLGITQVIIWSFIGLALIGSSVIPVSAFKNILPMLIYFMLGFLFYTTLFVGIGSAVNTEQEAQQITTYISLILMFPVVIALPAIQNPDFVATKIFSYIPLTIPTIMLLRLNIQDVSNFELLFTILIMVVSIVIATKISAKIFRIGILSYGNKLSIKEIFRWLKE
jgi:ABC-2 type transport system permease protein